MKYKTVLIKLSGEALLGEISFNNNTNKIFNYDAIMDILKQVKNLVEHKVSVAIVIGGGNIFRGESLNKDFAFNRVNADNIGMLSTMINGIALQDLLTSLNVDSRVYSAIELSGVLEKYNVNNAINELKKSIVTIFVAGTSNPFFTTDTAAAIRAIEIQADLLIKATKVNGIFNKDPILHNDAILYNNLSFDDIIEKKLKIMDIASFDLCRQHNINIQVCNIFTKNILHDIIINEKQIGTLVHG